MQKVKIVKVIIMNWYFDINQMEYLETRKSKKQSKNNNSENYCLKPLNNEDDIKPNTGNYGRNFYTNTKKIS